MGCVFLLLLLFNQVSGQLYPMRKYYYIDIPKTWHDAQTYCRENYDELAIFYSMEDIQLLSKPQPFSSAYAWIGLSDDTRNWKLQMGNASNSWIWTATGKPSRTGFQKFDPGEPNNYAAVELCGLLTFYGAWRDVSCVTPMASVCMKNTASGVTYTYISTTLSWSAALAYCRQYYTDLVMIEDAETHNKVIGSRPSVNTWLGLTRQAWVWPDGSLVTYNNWQGGKPTGTGIQYCVTEEETMHQWNTAVCETLNPFICHKVFTLTNKLKVHLQSAANLADPTLHTQILQKLVVVLRDHGYHVSKLEWSINPQMLK